MSEILHCKACGKQLPDDPLINFCPFCGVHLDQITPEDESTESQTTGSNIDITIDGDDDTQEFHEPEVVPEPNVKKGVPWEDDKDLSFFEKLTHTWSESIFRPSQFFENMPKRDQIGAALLYAFIFKYFGTILGNFWAHKQFDAMLERLDELPSFLQNFFQFYAQNQSNNIMLEQLIWTPLSVLFFLFLWPVLIHISLNIFGLGRNGFPSTFRVTSYAEGTALFQAIPFIGALIYIVTWGFLVITGVRESHETTTGRALLALAFPLLTCCAFFVILSSFIGMIVGL